MEESQTGEFDEWDNDNPNGANVSETMDFIFENLTVQDDELVGFETVHSPGKSTYWIPTCQQTIKPALGMCFNTQDQGIEFYERYASHIGFDVRKSSTRDHADGTTLYRRLLCSREGFKEPSKGENFKRKRASNRCGCDAMIYFKFMGNQGYKVTKFEERHNHMLLQDNSKQFLKSNRKLDFGQKQFMVNCAKANIGTAMTHRLLKEIMGGYDNVGPLLADFKNFKRDLLADICGSDAQMIIDRFTYKQQSCSAFYFAYDVDDEKRLTRLFWCDPIARSNYAAFGDVVSFDSTYRSNKYNMVLGPFTGIDNHRKAVTFGCGLLLKEDIHSYTWLMQHFQTAMCKDPKVLVTDQDPALRQVVPDVFPNTRHRFCMWHIMLKVPSHVDYATCAKQDFRRKLNCAVWSYELTVQEFEQKWHELIEEFELQENTWLSTMYDLRKFWIPAYFRDVLLGGLMRTTSISESANSFFGKFSRRTFTLSELMAQFENAMDAQRHTQGKNDMESETKIPDFKTPLDLERHAASILTLKSFAKVQDEIYDGAWNCHVMNEIVNAQGKVHVVREDNIGDFTVEFDGVSMKSICECNMFNRIGIPWNHIFSSYKFMKIERIPECMILARWRKDARVLACNNVDVDVVQQCLEMEGRRGLINKLWNLIYSTVGVVGDDTDRIKLLIHSLEGVKHNLTRTDSNSGTLPNQKANFVESLVGAKPSVQIEVHDPVQAKNKGSRRLKSALEKATPKPDKPLRKCRRCGKMAPHDKRNCKEILD